MKAHLLGVDFGSKRIGLAVSEPAGGVVSPLRVIEARPLIEQNARAILDVADEYGVEGLVLGLPLNMDGTEGPQAKIARRLAEAIHQTGSLPVYLHDERLTSHAADAKLGERGLTRKKKKARQDAVAAAILLQSYLDAL